ncbi:MAG: hypothetical protein HWE22_18860 [Flavobacteriales bacterium]|nr:hypothetical protein [Flavobacteriales bacterium]
MKNRFHYISVLLLLTVLHGCGSNEDPFFKASLDSTIYVAKQMDRANEIEFYRGYDFYDYLRYELKISSRVEELTLKRDKLSMIFEHLDSIENSCFRLISLIEKIKIDLLKKEGENIAIEKDNDPDVIVWKKYNPELGCLPSDLNLLAVERPKASDVVNLELIGESQEKLSSKGHELWRSLNDYRRIIVKHTGTYTWGRKEFKIDVKAINQYTDREDLIRQVASVIDASQVNKKEDRQVLIDLYLMLTKPDFIEKNGAKVHWVNSMFTNAPIVSAISSLSALQNEILKARSLAYIHWQGKQGHCCYRFNQIIPLATGPSTIKEGEDVEIKVSIAAFDSDWPPQVTIEDYQPQIVYENGLGIVTVKPEKGLQTIRGTVSIRNNSGTVKTEPWEWKVNVLEK